MVRCTHTRTHARLHARTHAHTCTHTSKDIGAYSSAALIARGWSVTVVRRVVGGLGTGGACLATWLVIYDVVPGGVLCVAVAMLGLNVAYVLS